MRRRPPHNITTKRARGRRAVQEHRDRLRRKLALYFVAVDAAVLDMLVGRGYLADDQVVEKQQVNKALSRYLWDAAHGLSRLH
jgi:hypothetical protein